MRCGGFLCLHSVIETSLRLSCRASRPWGCSSCDDCHEWRGWINQHSQEALFKKWLNQLKLNQKHQHCELNHYLFIHLLICGHHFVHLARWAEQRLDRPTMPSWELLESAAAFFHYEPSCESAAIKTGFPLRPVCRISCTTSHLPAARPPSGGGGKQGLNGITLCGRFYGRQSFCMSFV